MSKPTLTVVALDTLTPSPVNARRRNAKARTALDGSLETFGAARSIVVDGDGVVRAGDGTLDAARAAGITEALIIETEGDRLVVVKRKDWSVREAIAYALADNRTSDLSEWDADMLEVVLEDLGDFDFGTTEFDFDGLSKDLIRVREHDRRLEAKQDEVPELSKTPITRVGDVWTLGRHRVLCGDCRDSEDVNRLVSGAEINIAITSPPYASQRKYDEGSVFKPIPADEYVDWFELVQANIVEHLADDGSWFLNIKEHCEDGQRHLYVKDLTLAHVRQWDWLFVDEFVWTHGGTPKAVINRFKNGWEPIFHFSRANHKFRPDSVMHESKASSHTGPLPKSAPNVSANQGMMSSEFKRQMTESIEARSDGMAYPSNSLSLGKNREAFGHSAAFPVSLPVFFLRAFSDEGDAVYDPFLGSGTTLIAAEQLDRSSFGMEISPAYCDVIVERWQNFTGKKATRG